MFEPTSLQYPSETTIPLANFIHTVRFDLRIGSSSPRPSVLGEALTDVVNAERRAVSMLFEALRARDGILLADSGGSLAVVRIQSLDPSEVDHHAFLCGVLILLNAPLRQENDLRRLNPTRPDWACSRLFLREEARDKVAVELDRLIGSAKEEMDLSNGNVSFEDLKEYLINNVDRSLSKPQWKVRVEAFFGCKIRKEDWEQAFKTVPRDRRLGQGEKPGSAVREMK